MTRLLDAYADVLPYGLQPTPFGEVWRALQVVASTVWDVDPAVYRAGIAWGWYVQHNPDALAAQRDLVIAALISEQAPLIKADQTAAELVEYLRQWREYRPTYDRLEALYKLFAADVEILPISTPGAPPVSDTRLAFYVRVYGVDFSRLLTLEEAHTIAIRATPLGSRPIVYYEFEEQLSVDTQPLKAGIASINYENDAICEPVELTHYTFIVADATTGQIVSGFSNELVYGEIEGIILQPPRLVYGVDISVPTAQFWFTDEGRNYNEDKELLSRSILRDENGNRIQSPDSTMYDNVPILAYMHINGDMLESTDGTIEYYGSGSLRTLTSVNGSAVGESVWSVFAERVFTLSFANTQLPGITITMPADETGHKGTSITLPTMTGEYESGGKTWKPSAWDIGAFGSSYTLNADTVAHLIFEEVQQYQEITLYMQGGNKQAQRQVTSGFTGSASATYCYQLYVDEELTTPWTNYDYSNVYEFVTSSGTPFSIQKVTDLPDTYTSDSTQWKMAFILMDDGCLWLASNVSGSGYMSYPSNHVMVRIYPKAQQVFPLYANSSSVYGNTTINFNSFSGLFLKPGSSGNIYPGNWPSKSLIKVLGSAGNVVSEGYNDFNFATANGILKLINAYGSAVAKSVRCALLTFSEPVYYAELGSETYLFSGADRNHCRLYEKYPEKLNFEVGYSYKVIIPIALNGSATGGMQTVIDAIYFEPYSSTDQQAIIRTTSSDAFYLKAVWYIKTPSATVSNAGNFGQYNWTFPPDANTILQTGEICVLDDSGTPGTTYAYDSTKSYGVLQWQTVSGTRAGATELQIVGIEQGGQTIIGCKNVSSDPVTVSYVRVCVCSSSSATVVSVYNSSNVAYNAFKLSLSGIDYYYVLDGTQTAWVSDLSSIGYSLSPIST